MTKKKAVHIFFDEPDHELLKISSASFGMPMATYCKSLILNHLHDKESENDHPVVKKDIYVRKPRIIKNK